MKRDTTGLPGLIHVFDGIGTENQVLLRMLQRYRRKSNLATVFDAMIESVNDCSRHVRSDGETPPEVPLGDWLTQPAPAAVLPVRDSLVNAVLTHACHICRIHNQLFGRDRDLSIADASRFRTMGHSLGLFAALLCSATVADRSTFAETSASSMRFVFFLLLRSRSTAAGDSAERGTVASCPAIDGTGETPTPMLSIRGIDATRLADLARQHTERPGAGPVDLAISNTRRSHVLAGTPHDLAELVRCNGTLLAEPVKWTFLPVSAPFHTPQLRAAARRLAADRDTIGYRITGGSLVSPVFGSGVHQNLQRSADLFGDVVELSLCERVDWPAIVRNTAGELSLNELELTDLGPGPSALGFSREILEHYDSDARTGNASVSIGT